MSDRDGSKIVGVLLAAGRSRRMGALKPLLPFGDRSVLEQCLANYRAAEIRPIVVVLGYAADEIRDRLRAALRSPDLHVVINDRYGEGMLSSVQCGIRAADELGAQGVLLGLVDQPFVPVEAFRRVRDGFQNTTRRIVLPEFGGKRGHPIALDMALRDAILDLHGPDVGLRDLIRDREDEVLIVPMETDEILRDMDIPPDYRRELEKWIRSSHAPNREG